MGCNCKSADSKEGQINAHANANIENAKALP